jgi:putative tryptophan/tyrosine transport system substrate-binding protein
VDRDREKDMKIKITVLTLCAMLFALCFPAEAQQPTKIPRIGVLRSGSAGSHASSHEVFRQGLRELGYEEAKNILIEYRYAEGKSERWSALASELVRLKVEIIVVGGSGVARATQQATKTIPIVVGTAGDLIRTGLIASLARPGGNITGSTELSPEVAGKRLELLKEAVPKASRVAVLVGTGPGISEYQHDMQEMETPARQLSVNIQSVEVRDPSDFQVAYAAMTKQRVNAVIIVRGSFTVFHKKQLAELAAKSRLPSMCEGEDFAQDGCLIAYGPDRLHNWRRAAVFVDKILKGTKPADIPVEQPKKFEFVVNLKTAKQIGLTIPPNVLVRADRVIR